MPCPDFEAPSASATMTAAETAVQYILRRVANDRDFSHYMLHTQALSLCLEAEASRRGVSSEDIDRELTAAMAAAQPRLDRSNAGVADVVRLRQQLDCVGSEIADLWHSGKINAESYHRLDGILDGSRDDQDNLALAITRGKVEYMRGKLADLLNLFDQAEEIDPPGGGLTVLQIPCIEAEQVLKQARDAMRGS